MPYSLRSLQNSAERFLGTEPLRPPMEPTLMNAMGSVVPPIAPLTSSHVHMQ